MDQCDKAKSKQQRDLRQRLKLFNSFSRSKQLFVTNKDDQVKWYTCGPTVYDVAHLGHARCYITFDIIRRILAGHFGFDVQYVMNITDIDDKIIKRARSNYLCDKYLNSVIEQQDQPNKQDIVNYLKCALDRYRQRRINETDLAKLDMIKSIVKISESAINEFNTWITEISCAHHDDGDQQAAKQQKQKFYQQQKQQMKNILSKLKDIIADDQDAQLGHTIDDHEIFKSLTIQYEREFHDDMSKLDVLPASQLTRVSEYIDEIGLFIKKLESNGYAYSSPSGSIYFDVYKFDSNPKHSYAKLVREAFGHTKSLDDGEGELSASEGQEKKSPHDFVLWKASKPGEPRWQTQNFTPGRPGWHIECSVMASDKLGENFDLHSGGCDLKFPHHDNEIAQAEAYYDSGKNWVNYFIHSGHLTISGCKMSKSLKNFVTIRDALKMYSARQLRFLFLAHDWTGTLDFSDNTMKIAKMYEKIFSEFFYDISGQTLLRKLPSASHINSTYADTKLIGILDQTSVRVDNALCDNFDTKSALTSLSSLVKEYNKNNQCSLETLNLISSYIRGILINFGINFEITPPSPLHEAVCKFVSNWADQRAKVRNLTQSSEAQIQCDLIRDQYLPLLGVRLEDRTGEDPPYIIRFVDPVVSATEILERQQAKLAADMEKLKIAEEKEKKMKIPPNEMFIGQLDKFSKFDDKGFPTHDVNGLEISKSALKKLQRIYSEQEARYKRYLNELNK